MIGEQYVFQGGRRRDAYIAMRLGQSMGSLDRELEREKLAAQVEQKIQTLFQPLVSEFLQDKISGEELERRKHACREQAKAEHTALGSLDDVYDAYTAAVKKAEEAAKAAEEAKGAVLAFLNAFDGGDAPPSPPPAGSGLPGPSGIAK